MLRWILPEYIEDILPAEAARVEGLRRSLLDLFSSHGYELVQPPLLEYLDSLLTGTGQDLNPRTFKLVDQLSGRTMGLRADTTPQVARIDAHLLNRKGVTRLCYCGSVLHTLPQAMNNTRELVQLGAEIYGHAGLEADSEIIRLLCEVLARTGTPTIRLDIGHMGLFRALVAEAGLNPAQEEELFVLLSAKDIPGLQDATQAVAEPLRTALLALPTLYGGAEVLQQARHVLPRLAQVDAALDELQALATTLSDLPVSFDLADLRGYHYHSGVVFAAYCAGQSNAVAQGGRYDRVGEAFGRARPATGFSCDLRVLASLVADNAGISQGAVLAPWDTCVNLQRKVQELRQQGVRVIVALPGHDGTWNEAGCDRQLVLRDGQWVVESLQGE